MKYLLNTAISTLLWYSAIVWILKPDAPAGVILSVIIAAQLIEEFIKTNIK